jgi:hypothetical protein
VAARSAGIVALAFGLLVSGAAARSAGPTVTAAPTVTGTLKAGSRLAAGTGTWTSTTPVSYTFQWYRCDRTGAHCTSIHGATGPGLVLRTKDVDKTIGLTVNATDARGTTPAYSSLVGPVAGDKPLLVSTAQPQVTGLPVEGKPLQVTTGAWSPMPTSVSYAWQRCNANGRVCSAIAGASASTYTVSDQDVGHALVALVQATFGTTAQQALSTASTAAVGGDLAGPAHTARPTITGLAERGVQLIATAGLWTGVGALSYAYQWYRCDAGGAHCSSIHGATKTTYRTVAADIGKTLGFTVRATDSTGTAAAYSSLFGPVAPKRDALVSAASPAVTGSATPGQTLSVDAGLWQPRVGKLSYLWHRCNPNGRICMPVAGATKASYVVTPGDVGHALVALVTASLGSASQTAYSTASPPVR